MTASSNDMQMVAMFAAISILRGTLVSILVIPFF
jgi:hypothetical protein